MSTYYKDTVKDALFPKKKGVITKRNKYLKTIEPGKISAQEAKKLREKLSLSIAVFASVMNVSPKTVEAWESGTNEISGSALRLLDMIKKNPDILLECGALEDKTALK